MKRAPETSRGSHRSTPGGKGGACHSAMQIVVGVAMTTGELRTAKLENGFHLRGGDTLRQKMPGNPQVYNAPVRRTETLGNPPSVQTIAVDRDGLCGRRRGQTAQPARMRCIFWKTGWAPEIHGRLHPGIP